MPAANGHDPAQVTQAVELSQQTQLLAAILAELRSETPNIAAGDAYYRELILEHFPAAGSKRLLAHRIGNGFNGLSISTTGLLALPANEARLGCRFWNSGATNAIILFLSDAIRNGVPCVWLGPNGGSWDGMFGNTPWTGNVFAAAAAATSTLVGGEI